MKLLELSYKWTSQGSKNENGFNVEIYSFKSEIINHYYIIEIINYDYNIYIVQFYLKCHRLSDNRFNLLIPKETKISLEKDRNLYNRHVFFLLNTLTLIALEIIRKDSLASFGFMGAPTTGELNYKKNKENINPDKTIKETKRFRVYSKFIKRYFPPSKFTHIEYENSSCYLLQNNTNTSLNKEIADSILNNIILNKISS